MPITWLPWHVDSFARARTEGKPVLLFVSASWCPWCREMDEITYADPLVQRLVDGQFVPIRVDADRRPDIGDRYTLGGLPTTAFLTASGELLGGGTFVPLERMPRVLEQASGACGISRDEAAVGARSHREHLNERDRSIPLSAEQLADDVFATYDPRHGGFGEAPKFPLTAPVHFALQTAASNEPITSIVERTLDAMAEGGLHDHLNGGFFRCSATADWSSPCQEKLLDVNAALLRLYVEAGETLQSDRYLETAADVLRYTQTWLADLTDGGWSASQRADPAYYSLETSEARSAARAPEIDGAIYSSWNAMMSSATLRAARAFNDTALAEFAVKSLERIVLASYQPGGGVAHSCDAARESRGLLDDQILVASAALDAFDATGNITYEMMAEELALYALRTMWDEGAGGFFDRALPEPEEAVGLLLRRQKPFVSNCEAARLLLRLATSSGDHEFRSRAEATLSSVAAGAAVQGPLAAHYLLAMREAAVR